MLTQPLMYGKIKINMKTLLFFNIYNNYKHDQSFGHLKTKFKKRKFDGKFTRTI